MLPDRIESGTLVLRCFTMADAPEMGRAITASLEHLRPWMGWIANEPHSLTQRRALIRRANEQRRAGGDATYGIFLDGRLVGGTGLHQRAGPGVLEIGYWVHVDHVGRGLATSTARELTAVAFAQPDVRRVDICHDRANTVSGRIPARLGFRLMEEYRVTPRAPAESGVHLRWTVERDEWVDGGRAIDIAPGGRA